MLHLTCRSSKELQQQLHPNLYCSVSCLVQADLTHGANSKGQRELPRKRHLH